MNSEYISISDINRIIKYTIEANENLRDVYIKGEISNLKFHSRGHLYFSLKDEDSKVSCFLPTGNVNRIDFPLKEGLEVTAHGYIYLYERGGSYSINIKDMEVAGQGDLAVAFEKLKSK